MVPRSPAHNALRRTHTEGTLKMDLTLTRRNKTAFVAGIVTAASSVFSPLALGAPPMLEALNGSLQNQFRSTRDSVSGFKCLFQGLGQVCTSFNADTFVNADGTTQGSVLAFFSDTSTGNFELAFIQCFGPRYANSTSVNPGNGIAAVSAVLDPSDTDSDSDPDSYCTTVNVGTKVVINLSGQPDGNSSDVQRGFITRKFGGTTVKENFQSGRWSDVFYGAIGLSKVPGPFDGQAVSSQVIGR